MRSFRIETALDHEVVRLVELSSPDVPTPTYNQTFPTWAEAAHAIGTVGGHLAYTMSESVPRLVMFS